MALVENMIDELDNNGFVVTIEWMKRKYDEMNTKLFDGKLGDCYFELPKTGKGWKGNKLGYFYLNNTGLKFNRNDRHIYFLAHNGATKEYINKDNFYTLCHPTICLNGNLVTTEKSSLSTLVHEMCHYYTYRNGYVPAQGHGVEFKRIANIVTSRANGEIYPVQTYASKEEAAETEWADDVRAEIEKRKKNKIQKRIVVAVFKSDGKIRLVNATSRTLINKIIEIETGRTGSEECLKIVQSTDPELKEKLDKEGFNSNMASRYAYWDLDKWPTTKEYVKNYKGWDVIYQKEGTEPEPEDPNFIKKFSFKTTNGDTFIANNVTIEQLKKVLKERFPNWSDAAIERIINNQNYIVREGLEDRLRRLIKEELDGIKNTFKENDEDVIEITPDMDLSSIDLLGEARSKGKKIYNDKGEEVPETCTCGGEVGLYICGEPIYKCSKCGKYYGTMPFKKEKTKKKK